MNNYFENKSIDFDILNFLKREIEIPMYDCSLQTVTITRGFSIKLILKSTCWVPDFIENVFLFKKKGIICLKRTKLYKK